MVAVPLVLLADEERLDQVREALRRGDLKTAASRRGKVYRLLPITA